MSCPGPGMGDTRHPTYHTPTSAMHCAQQCLPSRQAGTKSNLQLPQMAAAAVKITWLSH